MSRNLTTGMKTALAASNIRAALFASFAFSTGTIYLWSGYGSITWNGNTWSGMGELMSMEKITEQSQVSATGVKFVLSGIPSTTLADALVANYRTQACVVYLVAFDLSTGAVTGYQQIFGGRMDQMTIKDSGETSTIELTVESRLIDLQRQRERRFTDADQKYFYPGDTGLQYVAGLQDQVIYWGASTPVSTPTAVFSNPTVNIPARS